MGLKICVRTWGPGPHPRTTIFKVGGRPCEKRPGATARLDGKKSDEFRDFRKNYELFILEKRELWSSK